MVAFFRLIYCPQILNNSHFFHTDGGMIPTLLVLSEFAVQVSYLGIFSDTDLLLYCEVFTFWCDCKPGLFPRLQQVCEQEVSCFHHGFEFYNVKCFVTIYNGMRISLNGLQIEKLVVMLFFLFFDAL